MKQRVWKNGLAAAALGMGLLAAMPSMAFGAQVLPEGLYAVSYTHLDVYKRQVLGGMLAGIGGSFLILSTVPSWVENMTGGRGWIALAIVTCAMWKPGAAMVAAYVFGGVEALAYQLQAVSVNVSPVLLKMMPYAATVVVLVAVSIANRDKGAAGPEALTTPFVAEDN